jgi:oligosaccharyl transferase complex subunit OST4
MISDDQLYTLALFLGSTSMVLIVAYHWLQINSDEGQAILLKENGDVATDGKKKGKTVS